MKQTLLSIALITLLSCGKTSQQPVNSQSESDLQLQPKITIDSVCYDNSHSLYNVWITFKHFHKSDVQTAQYLVNGSVIYSTVFNPTKGKQFVQLYTYESGATGVIDVYFVRDHSTMYEKTQKVSGEPCK